MCQVYGGRDSRLPEFLGFITFVKRRPKKQDPEKQGLTNINTCALVRIQV